MKYSYLWLKEYVPKMPEPKKLADLIMMRAFEVEGVEKTGKDYVLDIKVLPNRAFDCLSHVGMAYEIGAISKLNIKYGQVPRKREKKSKIKEDAKLRIEDFLKIEVGDKKLCPRYSARVMMDVKVGESPKWLKDRLLTCGSRPINNIVDATNYVMLDTGQPLHAFDLDNISPSVIARSEATKQSRVNAAGLLRFARNDDVRKTIIVRRAKKGEKIVTLDEGYPERKLDESILVIADEKEPIAIAGIKGGKKAEIGKNTKNIILEAANFDPVNIRKSSKALNLRTDASVRFENGINHELTLIALNRVVSLIQQIAGGKIASGAADTNYTKRKPAVTSVAHDYAESLLGISLKEKDILAILKRLDLPAKVIRQKSGKYYQISVPLRRNDLQTSEDLIEEIGRIYGYEKIPSRMPGGILVPAIKNDDLITENKIKDVLVGAGFSEVYNYSLISEKDKDIFDLDAKILTGPKNPLSQEQKYLRPNLAVGLIKNIKGNLRHFGEVKLFEAGEAFKVEGKKLVERRHIAGAISKEKEVKDNKIFYEIKGTVDLLLGSLGLTDFWYDDYLEHARLPVRQGTIVEEKSPLTPLWKRGEDEDLASIMHPLRRAQVKIGDEKIGWLGEVNKKIAASLEIEALIAIFELDFEKLIQLVEDKITYLPPSKYPAIERDLTVLTEQMTRVEQVLNIIENTGGRLVADVDLLDIYEGEHLDAEKKSLTFRIVFQSRDKTLTDAEVNKIMEKVIKTLEGEGMEVRKS